jgi:hypothetical protein
MSNPVLFPVAMCSPVRPFPSCPFSPLPHAYTVNRGQPPIQASEEKSSSRALSVHSEEQCECNASRGSNDVLLFASVWVKWPVHEPKSANFWAGRVPALLYLPAVNGVWVTVRNDYTCPSEFNPAVHTRPLLPTRTEWLRPLAALTNTVPGGAPRSRARSWRGAFSEITSTPGTPSAAS